MVKNVTYALQIAQVFNPNTCRGVIARSLWNIFFFLFLFGEVMRMFGLTFTSLFIGHFLSENQVLFILRHRSSKVWLYTLPTFFHSVTSLYQTQLIILSHLGPLLVQLLCIKNDTHGSLSSSTAAVVKLRIWQHWRVPKDMTWGKTLWLYSRITDFCRLWSVLFLHTHRPMRPLVLWPEVFIKGW